MIEIDGRIVSLDLLTEPFVCDVRLCRGACCVEGDSGAPLDDGEPALLRREWGRYKKYMTPAGIEAVERQGFAVWDSDGELTTPLVGGAECAYSFDEDGVTLCAMERAWARGETDFPKPVSCHLYPVRVTRFGNGTVGLSYHRWDICHGAVECGRRTGMPVYRALREPLIRCFGGEFYRALEEAARYMEE